MRHSKHAPFLEHRHERRLLVPAGIEHIHVLVLALLPARRARRHGIAAHPRLCAAAARIPRAARGGPEPLVLLGLLADGREARPGGEEAAGAGRVQPRPRPGAACGAAYVSPRGRGRRLLLMMRDGPGGCGPSRAGVRACGGAGETEAGRDVR